MDHNHFLELQEVSKIYQASPLSGIRSVSLAISKGTLTVISGESGSGKSTLLKVIMGLMSPDQGTILFKNERVRGPEERLIPGHDAMKIVSQTFDLNIYAKVYDNIAGQLPNTNLIAKRQKSMEVMEFLRIDHLAQKRVTDLSGGEQQRVAIARAVVMEPEVLLMDEPFSQIDAMLKNELRADIKRMVQYLGITIILVSHDPLDGLSLADHMVILKDGEVVESGSPRRLYNYPQSLYTARLLTNCNVLTSEEAQRTGINVQKERIVIYPEWVLFADTEDAAEFVVKDRYFMGFYEELLLERNGVQIRALRHDSVNYEKGEIVLAEISRFMEF